ncbi:MAG TPA: hypothetical protein VKA36_08165 [Solirubrobacterales bacterium]|nr:hypothetical protein [Solirubrobacterales bacterium]
MQPELGADTKAVLLAAGLIFIWALLLGIWKWRQMVGSPEGLAHPYVDVAHRAALLYSFATLLLAVFVELSGWSEAVNATAAFAAILFFVAAIATYVWHGLRRDTENQIRDGGPADAIFMVLLIVAEVGGSAVLVAGFVEAQIL